MQPCILSKKSLLCVSTNHFRDDPALTFLCRSSYNHAAALASTMLSVNGSLIFSFKQLINRDLKVKNFTVEGRGRGAGYYGQCTSTLSKAWPSFLLELLGERLSQWANTSTCFVLLNYGIGFLKTCSVLLAEAHRQNSQI